MSRAEIFRERVLWILQRVLVEQGMNYSNGLPGYQVQSVAVIARDTGRPMTEYFPATSAEPIQRPGVLRLTMRDGSEFDLTVKVSPLGREESKG